MNGRVACWAPIFCGRKGIIIGYKVMDYHGFVEKMSSNSSSSSHTYTVFALLNNSKGESGKHSGVVAGESMYINIIPCSAYNKCSFELLYCLNLSSSHQTCNKAALVAKVCFLSCVAIVTQYSKVIIASI